MAFELSERLIAEQDQQALIRRASIAKEVRENEIFKESVEVLRAAYMKALQGLSEKDDLGRFRYVEALKQVDAVMRHLDAVITTGEIAQRDIAEFAAKPGPVERLVRRF